MITRKGFNAIVTFQQIMMMILVLITQDVFYKLSLTLTTNYPILIATHHLLSFMINQ